MQLHLGWKLVLELVVRVGVLHGAVDVLTDEERTGCRVFCPPACQRIIVGCAVTYFPINLRNVIVHPSVVHPQQYIGIEVVVILQAVGGASVRIVLLVAVDAERRYTELHPWLAFAYGFMYLLDEDVHVVASPVALVGISSSVAGKGRIVREVHSRGRIWVEVVVHVEGIHVITGHDVADNLADVLAVFRQTWVEVQLSAIFQEELRMLVVRVQRRERGGSLGACSVRIDPCVQLHVAFWHSSIIHCSGSH